MSRSGASRFQPVFMEQFPGGFSRALASLNRGVGQLSPQPPQFLPQALAAADQGQSQGRAILLHLTGDLGEADLAVRTGGLQAGLPAGRQACQAKITTAAMSRAQISH